MKLFKKPFWILLALIALFLLYLPSLSQYFKLRNHEEKLNREISDLKVKIEALEQAEYLIKNDLDHLEKVIRQELGFARPGEVVYKLVPSGPPPPATKILETRGSLKVIEFE